MTRQGARWPTHNRLDRGPLVALLDALGEGNRPPCAESYRIASWFPETTRSRAARAAVEICRRSCPVLAECKIYSRSLPEPHPPGVWAGRVYEVEPRIEATA